MKIELKRFGTILTSRPEGREAALLLLANELRTPPSEIDLDFDGVAVMTPSWLGEFRTTLTERGIQVHFLPSTNASVRESILFTEAMDN